MLNQAAKVVAAIQPGFDLTEKGVPFPEELIKLIAFYSFPSSEEEIRLYSCLGCGNIDEFIRGENLYKTKGVQDCLQIGKSILVIVRMVLFSVSKFGSVLLVYARKYATGTNGLYNNYGYRCTVSLRFEYHICHAFADG